MSEADELARQLRAEMLLAIRETLPGFTNDEVLGVLRLYEEAFVLLHYTRGQTPASSTLAAVRVRLSEIRARTG